MFYHALKHKNSALCHLYIDYRKLHALLPPLVVDVALSTSTKLFCIPYIHNNNCTNHYVFGYCKSVAEFSKVKLIGVSYPSHLIYVCIEANHAPSGKKTVT